MRRDPNACDKRCEKCGEPMCGIMAVSDIRGFTAPRKVCYECQNSNGENNETSQRSKDNCREA